MVEMPHTLPGSCGRPDLRFIADRLGERARKLEESLERLAAQEPDSEAVHDVRVACRRLVGGLDAARDEIGGKKRVRKLRRALQRLRRRLGAAREAEVGLKTLESFGSVVTREEEILVAFLSASYTREIGAAPGRDAVDRLSRSVVTSARRLVVRLIESSMRPGPAARKVQMRDLRSRALDAMRARREVFLGRPREPLLRGDDAALHQLRIDGKKLRYTMEFYEPLFPSRLNGRIRLMKQLQDSLGEAHDLADLNLRVRDLAEGMCSPGSTIAQSVCHGFAARGEERKRTILATLAKFIRAVEHPGFLPVAEMPEVDSLDTPPAAPGTSSTASTPHLRVINAEKNGDAEKETDE